MRARPYSSDAAKQFYAMQAAVDAGRVEREARAASSRRRAPRTWAVVDLLRPLYWSHLGLDLGGILGQDADRFERTVAKYHREALRGTEISDEDACRLARWAWPFVMQEEQTAPVTGTGAAA